MCTRPCQRGVTLVEVVIVMVIVALVAASAAPGLRSLIDGQRLRGAAAQLAADLQFARAEAQHRGTRLRFSVGDGCYMVHSGSAAQCRCAGPGPARCDAGAQALRTAHLAAADGIVLQSNVGSIVFDPLHGTCTPTGTFRLVAADGRALHQVVNLMGRVRTCSPQGAVTGHAAC